jgi:transposase
VTDKLQTDSRIAIVALDEMGLSFQATLTRVYAPVGQTPMVKVSPQRDNVHFYGALDVRTGREVAVTAPEQTTDVTADFIRLVLVLFSTQAILLLLDRAPWHSGPAIDLLLEENPRLELMYFPPACPDLNPQEHVWEQAREAISHNHTCPVFDRLIDAFETFLVETPFQTDFMQHYGPPVDPVIFD